MIYFSINLQKQILWSGFSMVIFLKGQLDTKIDDCQTRATNDNKLNFNFLFFRETSNMSIHMFVCDLHWYFVCLLCIDKVIKRQKKYNNKRGRNSFKKLIKGHEKNCAAYQYQYILHLNLFPFRYCNLLYFLTVFGKFGKA
jgi:hypothetical protein